MRHGHLYHAARRLTLLSCLCAALICTFCGSAFGSDDIDFGEMYISVVKEGHLADRTDVTIGEAFEAFFDAPTWKGSNSNNGPTVEFNGSKMMSNGKRAEVCIQFTIDDDASFEATYFDIDGQRQQEAVYVGLMEDVYNAYDMRSDGSTSASGQTRLNLPAQRKLEDAPIIFGIKIGDSDDDVRIKLNSRFRMIKDHRISAENALEYLGELLSFSDPEEISHIPSAKRDDVTIDAPDGGSSIYSTGIRFNDAMADKGITRIRIETQYFNNKLIYMQMFIASANSGNADSQPEPEAAAALALFEYLSSVLGENYSYDADGWSTWEKDDRTFTLMPGDEWEPPTFTYVDTSRKDHIYYP